MDLKSARRNPVRVRLPPAPLFAVLGLFLSQSLVTPNIAKSAVGSFVELHRWHRAISGLFSADLYVEFQVDCQAATRTKSAVGIYMSARPSPAPLSEGLWRDSTSPVLKSTSRCTLHNGLGVPGYPLCVGTYTAERGELEMPTSR